MERRAERGMKGMFNRLAGLLLLFLLQQYKKSALDFAQIEAARAYIGGVRIARRAYWQAALLIVALLVMMCGFLILHVALFACVWSCGGQSGNSLAIGLLAALGALYFLAPLCVIVDRSAPATICTFSLSVILRPKLNRLS